MQLSEVLTQKDITMYRLSKESKVPYTTINDICANRVRIEKCSAETIYRISKVLDVTMESLVSDELEVRNDFETFKSNVCHYIHDMGDVDFIIEVLERGLIREYYNRKWYPEALYLLAMVDYLSRENDLPLCTDYEDIRGKKLKETIFPASILTLSAALKSERPKEESMEESIPEFMRFNIVESEVRNVV